MKNNRLVSSILMILIMVPLLTSCFVEAKKYDTVVAENALLNDKFEKLKVDYEQIVLENSELRESVDIYRLDPQRLYVQLETAYADDDFEIVKDAYNKLKEFHINYEYFPLAKIIYEKVVAYEDTLKNQSTSEILAFTEINLGTWKDSAWNADVVIKQKDKNRVDIIYYFNDGSSHIGPHNIKEVKDLKVTLTPSDNYIREYFILDLQTNNLNQYDDYGYLRTLRPVKVGSLLFLNSNE